jgi:acetylornithine deacetylase/succinyl-diaminopimelate desuccinylase-like protein
MFAKLRFALRMLFWLTVAGAIAWLLWYMVKVPGTSYSGALQPLAAEEKLLADRLSRHVAAIASREHNFMHPVALEAAARYIETAFEDLGYGVAAQRIPRDGTEVRNVEIELPGGTRAEEIVVVGAHYDSVVGAVGANDNGSGVAALIELARLLHGTKPARTLRFVAFVDEEPPFYYGDQMGSRHYARRSKSRGENIVAMFSLETIGYYSDEPDSQRYPVVSSRSSRTSPRARCCKR